MQLRRSIVRCIHCVKYRATPSRVSLTTGQLETRVSAAENPSDALNPYPTKPRLTFNPSGTFKMTIFSDLHYGENPWDAWGPQQDVNSAKLMRTVLANEQPDYVYAWSCTWTNVIDTIYFAFQRLEWGSDYGRKYVD